MHNKFNSTSKKATQYTKKANSDVYQALDFENKEDFINADRGFIAPLIENGLIPKFGNIPKMQFVQNKKAPAEVNPSLWRHAQLVNRGGLYEVLEDKIYQVRGQDISNFTFIETTNGVILYDIGYSPKAFTKAWQLYKDNRGDKLLVGIIISHSHADHYGGFSGIIEAGLASDEDFQSGKIQIYVPEHFIENCISENVIFGNIMGRRSNYQYGFSLPKDETGVVTTALGPIVVGGDNSLPKNVVEVTAKNQTVVIDGLEFEFMLTPDTEAPSEMVFYIPEWKAISMAENVNHLQHNIYTMRGAKTRDANAWATYINKAVYKWGINAEVIFGPHTWPTWGNIEVNTYLKNQRDLYKGIYDQTVRLANKGYRPDEIAEKIQISPEILNYWSNRPYYGNFKNNIISTYFYNLGWFNANSTEIAKHNDIESGKRYVDVIGGENVVIEQATKYYEKGDYRFVVDLLNKIISYNSNNTDANYLMADAFEQLGYQEENALLRNWYLTTAKELLDNNLIKITGSKDSYLNFINSIDLDSSINFNLVKRA